MCEAVVQAFDSVSLILTSMKDGHVHSCCCVCVCVCVSVGLCVYYIKLMNEEQMAPI